MSKPAQPVVAQEGQRASHERQVEGIGCGESWGGWHRLQQALCSTRSEVKQSEETKCGVECEYEVCGEAYAVRRNASCRAASAAWILRAASSSRRSALSCASRVLRSRSVPLPTRRRLAIEGSACEGRRARRQVGICVSVRLHAIRCDGGGAVHGGFQLKW